MRSINGLHDESAEPKTEIGRRQIQALGLDPQSTVLVGDMEADAALARALGTGCVLVPWGHNSVDRLLRTGFPVVDSCGALLNRLTEGCV